jgi:hypothetical protein
MKMDRKIGYAPKVTAIAKELTKLQGPCIGCPGCTGLCVALIDALTVPDVILAKAKV